MRGRKPKPTVQRELTGNAGHRPLNTQEPQITYSDEPPPPMLTSAAAVAEWNRLVPILKKARQITDADRSALIACCFEWGRYKDANDLVKTLVVLTPSGYPMPNPYISVANKALGACLKLWPELGLTPSSRTRVKTIEPLDGDPFAEFDQPLARVN